MAKNYTISEAVRIISAGTDMEAITDIGRRYPILLHKVTKVAAKAGEEFVDLMNYMPEHLTANKVNTLMKNSVEADEATETEADEEVSENTDKKPAKATKEKATKSESTGSDYESMSGKELWELLGKHGKRKDCKDKMGGAKKDDMIAYINKYGLEATEAEDEVEEATETSENPYEGIAAPELFKECKKRGIKAAPKKPAKYYIDLLMKSDEEVASKSDEVEEDDDWGDEPEEKTTKKAEPEKKSTKKAAKKEEAADEDDDWDI